MKKIFSLIVLLVLVNLSRGQESRIDTDLEVGTLPGIFGVSPTGAATYAIPIDLPKGRGGMTPNLAFMYNSQNGNGIMGKGWSMSGFSSIRRVNPTLYHDGRVQQLNFGEEDGFMLDGQRLIKVQDLSEGAVEYRTEIDQIVRIIYYPNGGVNGLDYWVVNYKNGIEKIYGYTIGSRQYNSNSYSGSDYPIVWHITNMFQSGANASDINQNKRFYQINYFYEQQAQYGECHPIRIEYNSINEDSSIDDPNYIVYFGYDDIQEENQRVEYYQFGEAQNQRDFRVRSSKRLTEIKIEYSEQENSPISIYTLNYALNQSLTKEAYLNSIQQEKRGPQTQLEQINATNFNWDFYNPSYTIDEISNYVNVPVEGLASVYITGIDVDGDGKDEIAEYKTKTFGDYNEYKVFVHGLDNEILVESSTSDLVKSLQSGDFNNDGKDELIVGYGGSFKIYSFSENNNVWTVNPNPYENNDGYGPDGEIYAADINGDGQTDCITTRDYDSKCSIYIGTGNLNNIFLNEGNAIQFWYTNFSVRSVLDFTGDGNVEILATVAEPDKIVIKIYDFDWDFVNNTGSFKPPIEFEVPRRGSNLYQDFNGDGKSDILQITDDDTYYFYPSYGSGIRSYPAIVYSQTGLNNQAPVTIDMNGDGRTDLVTFQKMVNSNIVKINVGYAKPDGVHFDFSELGQYELINPDNFNEMGIVARTFADLKGNGVICPVFELKCQEAGKQAKSIPQNYILKLVGLESNSNFASEVIDEITNGFGVTTHIEYAPFSSTYTSSNEQIYPLGKYKSNRAIVKEKYIEYEDGLKLNHIKYSFSDPVMHKKGKGFLGFLNSETLNLQNNTKTINSMDIYQRNGLYCHPYLKESTTYVLEEKTKLGTLGTSGNQMISHTQNNFDVKNTNGNEILFFPVTTSSLTNNWDVNGAVVGTRKTIINKNDIDTYGNIKKQIRLFSEEILDMSAPEERYSYKYLTEATFKYDLTHWILNRMDARRITKKDISTNEEDISQTFFTYHAESNVGWPFIQNTYTIPNGNTGLAVTMKYEYDKYGNIVKETLSANNETPKITQYEYSEDYNGRFLTAAWQTKNGVNYKTVFTYHEEYGLLASSIENPDYPANKRTTEYYYDAFGNTTLIKLPGNLYLKTIVSFFNQSKQSDEMKEIPLYYSQSYMYSEGNQSNSAYWMNQQIGYYNKYQMNIFNKIWDQNNRGIISFKHYDDNGRLESVENPHHNSEINFLSTTYEYDAYGRLQTVNSPGASLKTIYNGLNTTVTNLDTDISKTTLKNAIGQTKRITDASGVIDYNYYSSGTLKQTTVNGISSLYQYDDANRLVEQADPDLGTITYDYDNYGQLTGKTDDKGAITTIMYDELGRVTEKYILDKLPETIVYTYQDNPAIYGLGLLKKEEVAGVNAYNYVYDQFNRLTAKTENIDGMDYTHHYAYDDLTQQLETIEFPSGYSVNYVYRANGNLHQVTNASGNTVLWEAVDNNGMGQLTEYNLGNGITTTKEFDAYGYITNITSNIFTQNLNYQFDPSSGNLLSRSVERKGYTLTESFTYDEKETNNRLESWTVNGNEVYNVSYQDNGNIYTKSDITVDSDPLSVYSYGSNVGEHALTQINNPVTEYLAEAESPQSVIYNAYDKVAQITKSVQAKHGSEYSYTMEFQYGADQARKISFLYRDNLLLKTKYYIGNDYEEEKYLDGNTRKLHYLSGGDGVFAIYVDNTMKSDSLYYIHKDYQGNMETITGEQGQLLETLSFDPWGRRRDCDTWQYAPTLKPQHFDRGYTMHEHLDIFGLINMNGRMYDPWVGRMLSPDPFMQDPGNLQNYNRYSYALNNPLKYIDPSGYHHGSVFKPFDWDAGIGGSGGNGLLYLNTSFSNDHAGNAFDGNGGANDYFNLTYDQNGYLVENTTSYNYHSGYYQDPQGNTVEFNDVFNNFVEPNSVLSAQGESAQKIFEGIQSGLSYFAAEANGNTVLISAYGDLGSPVISATGALGFTNPTAAVHLGAFSVFGRAGIAPLTPDESYQPTLLDMLIHSEYRQGISLAVGLESTMVSIAANGNRAKTVLQVAKATNYTGAAFGVADNFLNAKLATEQGNMTRAYFEYSQMVLYGVGAGMLESRRLAPIGGALIFGLGLIDLGQYWYDNN